MNEKEITTIILAAGFSSRMNDFKPLVKYKGKTFLENIVRKTAKFSVKIIVVTGYRKNDILDEIEKYRDEIRNKIKIVFNENFADGMFSSIKTGISEVKTTWALLHFVDQPSLPQKFYEELISKINETKNWIQPAYKGKKAHPVLIERKIFDKILSAPSDSNLKKISETLGNKCVYETDFIQTLDNFNERPYETQ